MDCCISQSVALATTSKSTKKKIYFITKTAYLSAALNTHNLLYLILFVKEKQLRKESLNIYLFNSQSCEGMLRNTRSLSGAYSTIINFTIHDFLRQAEKLSVLNHIKCTELINQNDENILFPIHHKHKTDNNLLTIPNLDDIAQLDIEQIILDSYHTSIKLTERLNITTLLKKHRVYELGQLSKFIFNKLSSRSKLRDNSSPTPINNVGDDSTDSKSDDSELNHDNDNNSDEDNDYISDDDDDNENIQSTKTNLSGIHIKDKTNLDLTNSYFKIKINDTDKYFTDKYYYFY
ncbi:unnamed protein product [Didymodactylos carnosus]|uniref:Uncharacterized protein n=1 Tax=Didymodactylos carnosus TaxID=1234261 RepID=A0A8S2PJU6_9BILA|nr:unnamed protein product [Didymodactylos carnosus]CAF4049660.1 unnamed protein product [Didymodactylos carnosus]